MNIDIGCCCVRVPLHTVDDAGVHHYWCDDCNYLYSVTQRDDGTPRIQVNRESFFEDLKLAAPWGDTKN